MSLRFPTDLLPLRGDWDWFSVKTGAFTLTPGQETVILTDQDLPQGYEQGYLHSLDLQCSSSLLFVQSTVASDLARQKIRIEGTLNDFLSANFDHRVVMPGDPVVVDRAALALTTPPEFTARVGPSFAIPFRRQFKWMLRNDDTSTITVYGHELYFILFKEPLKETE